MRWAVLLLLMLNAFYYLWHQQEAPLRAKQVASFSGYTGARQDIRLLGESGLSESRGQSRSNGERCLYLGGDIPESEARIVEQRLTSLDIKTQFAERLGESGAIYWLKVEPDSRRLLEGELLDRLRRDFPRLKNKIMSCEGIATAG